MYLIYIVSLECDILNIVVNDLIKNLRLFE